MIELKHLAPYLPYGLELTDSVGLKWSLKGSNINFVIDRQWKPILKPLVRSMDSEDFLDLHSEWSRENFIIAMFTELGRCGNWKHFVTMEQLEWLLENHYDVFGLIEKGLAVDVNTTLANAN